MAINPNNGVLDIINGTLKVSSIDIKQAGGFTTAINTVARNDVLLFDDQKSTTTFTPTAQGGYMSSTGVTRDTSSNYLELGTASDAGWVYWPLQLPNSWHTEFDMHVTATGGVLTYSLFNTSEPNHTNHANNDGGYKIVFDNTNNQIVIYWEGSVHKTVSATLRSNDWQHVNINYFQGAISVSLAGKVVLTHEFTQNYQEFDSRYIGFSATAGTSHKIRHLRVHNSDKWLYTKTSNASDISYVSGNVGIGSLSPTELLDVHGNVHIAKNLTVDGNLTVSGTATFIDSTNLAVEDPIIELARGNTSDTIDAGLIVTRNTSNVAVAYRGDEEELALGYTQSGASDTDVTPIADGGLDVRVYGNLFANNLTTTANVEATYLKGNGSEITQVTLDQVVGYANTTANTIQLTNSDVGLKVTGNVEANYFVGNGSKLTGLVTDLQSVADNGNTSSNTIQFTNATTAFVADSNVGIGTDAPTANLHVMGYQYVNGPPTLTNAFDHSDAPLTLTHGTATSDTAINDPKPLLHLTRDGTTSQSYGARASFNLSRYENSSTHSRSRLDVALADGTYAESPVMTLRSDGKVGVGVTSPAYKLDVDGDINLSSGSTLKINGTPAVFSNWTVSGSDIYRSSGNVGVGTTSPQEKFHLYGSPIIQHETRYDVGANDGWYKIGTWDAASATGARLKISLLGAKSYSALESARGGETIIYASINNNIPTTDCNMSGSIHAYGNPIITQAKFKQVGTDRTQYEIIAYVETYTQHSMKIECSETTTFTRAWTSASDPGADSATVQAAKFTHVVDNAGNVGIGTASPYKKLEILTDTDWDGWMLKSSTNNHGYLQKDGNGCSFGMNESGSRKVYIRTNADSYFNGGNVGIGTATPQSALHVAGDSGPSNTSLDVGVHMGVYSTNYPHIEIVAGGSNTGWIDFKNGNTTGNGDHTDRIRGGSGHLEFITNQTERMRIDSSGNVGIGTNNPEAQLHIGPKDNNHIYLASVNNDYGWKIDTDDQNNGIVPFRIIKRTNDVDSTVVTIKNQDGKVGIWTTDPTELLHVNARSSSESAFIRIQSGSGGTNPATESGIKMTESGQYGFQFVHSAVTDLLKVKHQDANGAVNQDNIMIWHPNGDVQWGKTARFNFHYNPTTWSYSTNQYQTTVNFWSVSYNFPHEGYVFATIYGHWSRKDANNSGHAGGNQAFYGWVSLDNKEPVDSSLYDNYTGSAASFNKFHEYWSPDTDGAGSWRDFSHTAFYKVSAGWHSLSLRVTQYFTSGHYLNINGSGLIGFYIPKHYL